MLKRKLCTAEDAEWETVKGKAGTFVSPRPIRNPAHYRLLDFFLEISDLVCINLVTSLMYFGFFGRDGYNWLGSTLFGAFAGGR